MTYELVDGLSSTQENIAKRCLSQLENLIKAGWLTTEDDAQWVPHKWDDSSGVYPD